MNRKSLCLSTHFVGVYAERVCECGAAKTRPSLIFKGKSQKGADVILYPLVHSFMKFEAVEHRSSPPSNFLERRIKDTLSVGEGIYGFADRIERAANLIVEAIETGNKLLLCGNGGSAAEAQHMAAEYVSSLRNENIRRSLPAVALTTDTSFLTATGNDYGFEKVFERQIESLGITGDVLIAISTSGSSQNVMLAIQKAKERGLKVIGLTGKTGGKMGALVDILLNVPSDETMRIQEWHMFIDHTIVELVEYKLFGFIA